MSSNNDNIQGQPPAKRQRRSLGASDRVVLDVGGTKFITSASTLTSNSAYFASLLLIIGLNRTMARMMRYLLIKIQSHLVYQEHGGIMRAISAGLFPYFLEQNDNDAEKEFATVRVSKEDYPGLDRPVLRFNLKEVGKPGPEQKSAGIHCALNCLHLKGYTHHESQLKTKESYSFSRRKHDITMSSGGVTDIFIPNDNGIVVQERNGYIKQFAIVLTAENEHRTTREIAAPAEFNEDESIRSNPLDTAAINNTNLWLEDNEFVTRENEYEGIFREHYKDFLADNKKVSIFSRVISKTRDDASW